MSFCCADLVEMFSLTDTPITVIAGHAYLHREIQWVYLAEAVDNFLDTIPWTKGGELAIVTGSSIKGDSADGFTLGIPSRGFYPAGVYGNYPSAAKNIGRKNVGLRFAAGAAPTFGNTAASIPIRMGAGSELHRCRFCFNLCTAGTGANDYP